MYFVLILQGVFQGLFAEFFMRADIAFSVSALNFIMKGGKNIMMNVLKKAGKFVLIAAITIAVLLLVGRLTLYLLYLFLQWYVRALQTNKYWVFLLVAIAAIIKGLGWVILLLSGVFMKSVTSKLLKKDE